MERDALTSASIAASTPCSRPARVKRYRRADATPGASITARRALGFEDLLDDDIEAMRTKTRRYAKRQVTWLRKLPGAHLIDTTDRTPEDVASELVAMI